MCRTKTQNGHRVPSPSHVPPNAAAQKTWATMPATIWWQPSSVRVPALRPLLPGLSSIQGSRARAPGPDQSSRLRFLSLCLSFLCLSSLPCFELLPCLSFLCELLFLCDLCPLLSLWLFSFLLFFDEPFASN